MHIKMNLRQFEFLIFALFLPFCSSCSNLAERKLDRLQPSVNCNFVFKDENNRFFYKTGANIYNISEKYDGYFNKGKTSIIDTNYLIDNNFYNLAINNNDNSFSYLVSNFDVNDLSIQAMQSFNHQELTEQFPILRNHYTFGVTSSEGYHYDGTLDFVLTFFDRSENDIIVEIEMIYDQKTMDKLYFGERFPDNYDPEQVVLDETGGIIKKDDSGKNYLEFKNNSYFFDEEYLENKCEHYKYIKTNIYPQIDSYSHHLFRQDNNFFFEISPSHSDIKLGKTHDTKTLIFMFDYDLKCLKYCGNFSYDLYLEKIMIVG